MDHGDVAEAFDADIDVSRPGGSQTAFFLVKRRPGVDHERFFEWLTGVVGGPDNLLFHHSEGLFVVWTTFELSRWLEDQPDVATVGGVDVDQERLQQVLTPAETPE